jgi:hypothetical protein
MYVYVRMRMYVCVSAYMHMYVCMYVCMLRNPSQLVVFLSLRRNLCVCMCKKQNICPIFIRKDKSSYFYNRPDFYNLPIFIIVIFLSVRINRPIFIIVLFLSLHRNLCVCMCKKQNIRPIFIRKDKSSYFYNRPDFYNRPIFILTPQSMRLCV